MQLAVVGKLLDVGLRPEAARELKSVTATAPDDPSLAFRMAELYDVAGEPLKAMGILQRRFRDTLRHGSSNVPSRFWEILYPRAFWTDIESAARKAGIDPYMAAAIIRQESAFDPTVVSNAGAVGLMQIMPAEASRIAEAAGLPATSRDDLFDPRRNTEIGAAEFVQKTARMNGDRNLAIAAYNAGEEAVGRWIAKTPIDDIDTFIESIPYNETRLYVKNVTRNLNEYRRIYGQQQLTSGTRSPS
jgi:soluble lytic murein transglycosylase